MARHGDGLYLRGQTWYLDCRLNGARHVVRLGKGIARHAAKEIAQVTRGAILTGEAGIARSKHKPIGCAAWCRARSCSRR
jgi:hypothetical protein